MLRIVVDESDPQLAAMCRRYWAHDGDGWVATVAAVAAEFGVPKYELTRRVQAACTAWDEAARCLDCEGGFQVRSRSEYPARLPHDRLCAECREGREAEAARRAEERHAAQQQVIAKRYAMAEGTAVDVEELTFSEGAALLAVLRGGSTEDYRRILPLREWTEPLSPRFELSIDLLRQLYQAGVLSIGPESPVEAFEWEEDSTPNFYLDRVEWRLSGYGPHAERVKEVTEELNRRFRDVEWAFAWASTWRSTWDSLLRHEALAYLETCLEDHGLPFTAGEKTHDTLAYVLETFSLGQAYYFIWGAARDAAAYYMRDSIPKQRAANSVVGRIRSRAERAQAENWDVNSYRRDRRCPMTLFGEVVFSLALRQPDPFPVTPAEIRPPLWAPS